MSYIFLTQINFEVFYVRALCWREQSGFHKRTPGTDFGSAVPTSSVARSFVFLNPLSPGPDFSSLCRAPEPFSASLGSFRLPSLVELIWKRTIFITFSYRPLSLCGIAPLLTPPLTPFLTPPLPPRVLSLSLSLSQLSFLLRLFVTITV